MKGISLKTIGIASAVGVAGLGTLYVANRYMGNAESTDALLARMADAEASGQKHPLFSYLPPAEALALQEDEELSDLTERLFPYFKYDEDIGRAIVEAAAGAAEFKLRMSEIAYKKSIPQLFGTFTRQMVMQCRALRNAVRQQQPTMLEEFDELVDEVVQYKNDNHHNMWCAAHDA